jgi:hypothetical protein
MTLSSCMVHRRIYFQSQEWALNGFNFRTATKRPSSRYLSALGVLSWTASCIEEPWSCKSPRKTEGSSWNLGPWETSAFLCPDLQCLTSWDLEIQAVTVKNKAWASILKVIRPPTSKPNRNAKILSFIMPILDRLQMFSKTAKAWGETGTIKASSEIQVLRSLNSVQNLELV